MDADDVWLPQKLAEQAAILEEHPEVAMVYGRAQFWYSWMGRQEESRRDYFMDLGVLPDTVVMPPALLPLLWTHKAQLPYPSNAMVRRAVFATVGRFEESFRSVYEDIVFFTKVELNAAVFVAGNFWSKHRQHNHSSMAVAKFQSETIAYDEYFFNWAEKYLIDQGQKDTEIWQTLQQARSLFSGRGYLNAIIDAGRKILPAGIRHYLWLTIGSKLYGQRIEGSGWNL